MAGRANGLQVIDGPYLKVRDPDGLPRLLPTARKILGYDGKWALHPDQVTILNEVFSPTQEQFDKAWDILDAYEKATTEGDRMGAVMFGDEMIDEASRKMANQVRHPRRAGRPEALPADAERQSADRRLRHPGARRGADRRRRRRGGAGVPLRP